MADDAEDAVGGNERLCRIDDVEQQGSAADFVEDFGALAFEPRALSRGHDCHCETGCFHGGYLLTAVRLGSNERREDNESERGSDGDERSCSGQ